MKTINAYRLTKAGAPARLAMFRAMAAASVNNRNPSTRLNPTDWRAARHYTLKSYAAAYCHGMNQGADGSSSIWYCHTGEQFRNERYADEVARSIRHTGWFCDRYQDEKARGIVASLPHGRFIAGYELSDSGERVYFDQIHDDERDAALMADEHARVIAEKRMEDSEEPEEVAA